MLGVNCPSSRPSFVTTNQEVVRTAQNLRRTEPLDGAPLGFFGDENQYPIRMVDGAGRFVLPILFDVVTLPTKPLPEFLCTGSLGVFLRGPLAIASNHRKVILRQLT